MDTVASSYSLVTRELMQYIPETIPIPGLLLRLLILSALNHSLSHRCGFEHSYGHVRDKPSSVCECSGGFSWEFSVSFCFRLIRVKKR